MAIVINGSGTVTGLAVGGLPDGTVDEGTLATDSVTAAKIPASLENTFVSGRKNLIINGAMQVAQRGTSTALVTNGFTVDRWKNHQSGSTTARFTITQDTDTPSGFSSSLKWDCTTALATLGADDALHSDMRIEGLDIQHLAYGTSDAKSLTVSFWIKSNKVGTYVVWMYLPDGARHSANTYTIDTADTWEKKTLTFAGNTTQVISNDNTSGMYLRFVYGAGSDYTSGTQVTSWANNVNANRYAAQTVNLADSTSNYLNITGVQLEVGSTATEFEHRSYGEELALCQRYYQAFGSNRFYSPSLNGGTGKNIISVPFIQVMRVVPTLSFTDRDGNSSKFSYHSSNVGSTHNGDNAIYTTYFYNGQLFVLPDSYTGYTSWVQTVKLDSEL
jgi:hypothetical protein